MKRVAVAKSLKKVILMLFVLQIFSWGELYLYWGLPLSPPIQKIWISWTLVTLGLFGILAFLVSRLSVLIWPYFFILSSVWLLGTAGLAIRLERTTLAFYLMALLAQLITLFGFILRELKKSYYRWDKAWYEGRPNLIPGLSAHYEAAGHTSIEGRVSRIDEDGIFIHFEQAPGEVQPLNGSITLSGVEGRSTKLDARLMVQDDTGRGLGLEWNFQGIDDQKDFGDFLEALRGRRYVSN
jgi:hypothetical protein